MLEVRPDPTSRNVGSGHGVPSWLVALGWVGLIWYVVVVAVCTLGYLQIPNKSTSSTSPEAPHITVIRPVKGLEPRLYECLASTFRQDYPSDKLTVYFCVATRADPAVPILEQVLTDFPHADARLFVEDEDPLLNGEGSDPYDLGPNPKIRNMSRAYREARGDIVWIIDCNVWVGKGVCGRMVDRLCGFGSGNGYKYKFVHHVPIVVDVDEDNGLGPERQPLLRPQNKGTTADSGRHGSSCFSPLLQTGGGRLEELFMSSSHAKMYTAINTVLIAPCIVGKSNMFRRSHLDYLTAPSSTDPHRRNPGIDYFSDNICEDHLIGDLLWKKQIREEKEVGERWGKHGIVFGDFAFQPVANMSVKAYIARRVRWLRVRKFTVLLATLVEPGTESLLCSVYGAFGITTSLAPYCVRNGYDFCSHLTSWSAFFALWVFSVVMWAAIDWTQYLKLHSAQTVEVDENTPSFVRARPKGALARRHFLHWLAAWIGREALALPIWIWAFYGGVTVVWRDRVFRVGLDMKVREIGQVRGKSGPVSMDSSYDNLSPVLNGQASRSRSRGSGERNKVRRD
ncbi:Ceramide glucosyltransferase [Paecilomyces lecythidis]|uniref:Ceramide glucosyltransferase n=1 Tax=Paecilomyces lecythidis TaxID=3004212 RepID=A0ABR3XJS3_9EURO